MTINNVDRFKEKIARGELCVGTTVSFTDPAISELIGDAGYDFTWVDMEHCPIDIHTALGIRTQHDRLTCLIERDVLGGYDCRLTTLQNPRASWRATLRVEHHARRRVRQRAIFILAIQWQLICAQGQAAIIRQHGVHTGHYQVSFRPQTLHIRSRVLACDPLTLP